MKPTVDCHACGEKLGCVICGEDADLRAHQAEALEAFVEKLGRAIERTEEEVSDRKARACQVLGLRGARLMAIEAADKLRNPS